MFPRRGEEEEEDSLFEDEDQEQPEVTTIQKPMRKTPRRQAVHIIDEVLAEEDAFLDEEEFKEPAPKKSRVPMMTAPVKDILASYTPSSTQPLNQIYDKNWKITGQQFVDAMDIDGEPSPALLERHEAEEEVVPSIVVPDSEYKKSLFEKTTPAPTTTAPKRKLETKIIDDPIEGRSKKRGASSASSSSSATATIMSPAMLNERHHDIAAQTSKILNESMRKLLAVDKSVFDNNLEADMHIKIAMEDFTKLFQALDVRIFNPDHVPSTADDGMDAPSIPILYRAYIFKYLRAPVFENHERACCRGENCESHKMFLQYKTSTANNIKAGPQFPLQTQSFALRELLLPAVEEEIVQRLARGENMAEIMRTIKPQVCYLCHLKLVNEWVIMAASKNKPIVAPTVLQPFAIKIGTAGEYNSDALLSCGSNNLYGLVAPFPEFIYDNYVPFMHTVPLDRQRKETRTVLGWAEVNEIICEPSSAMHPRGYPPESSGYAAPSSSSSSSLLFGGGGNSV